MIKKQIKAWANVNKRGVIRLNNDEPRFLCIHKTKKEAEGGAFIDEKTIQVIINILED